MEYLYDDGEYFYFTNTENHEQMHLTKELLGDATAALSGASFCTPQRHASSAP
jgi:elongation factor P